MRLDACRTLLGAVVSLALTGSLAGCTGPASATPGIPAVSLPVTALASTTLGPTSAGLFQTSGSRVVGDTATWSALWAQMWANESAPPALPAVDFSTTSVLVAWMGQRPTGGYEIDVTRVTESAGMASANVVWTSPGPACPTVQLVTSPIVVVSIPHRDPASVQFLVTQATRSCGS
jgi:hypothetical protein